MLGTTDQQILKLIYTWGCEMPKSSIESQMQFMVTNEINGLRGQGMILVNGPNISLTPKGSEFVESNRLVSLQTIQQVQSARSFVKKALRSVLEHDVTGYNVCMQEARKAFPPRFVTAIERFFWNNLP